MQLFKAIILGLIQGLTEFLPVSSSGHLVLAGHFMNFQKPSISFEVFLHFGSLLAVLIYFRKDIWKLIDSLLHFQNNEPKHKDNRKVILYLILATLATSVIALSFEDFFEAAFSSIYLAASMLIVTGIILFISDKFNSQKFTMPQIGWLRSIIIGFGQSLAILPGISRSGTTIAVGIFGGLKRADAARFSFLLSIPAILGANIMKIAELSQLPKEFIFSYVGGAIAAFFSGYLVISWLLKLVKNSKLKFFSYYCWLIAAVSIVVYSL